MKYLIYLILFLSLSVLASATLLDKPILNNINGCYNLTITYSLDDGNDTPISFNGCTNLGNSSWECNCNTENYDLVMETDNTILRQPRKYSFEVTMNLYDFCSDTRTFSDKDWGDYNTPPDEVNFDCSNKHSNNNVKIFYINRTIDVPVYYNVTQYVDRFVDRNITEYVNVTQYVENESRLNNCVNIINRNLRVQTNLIILYSIVFLLIGIIASALFFNWGRLK